MTKNLIFTLCLALIGSVNVFALNCQTTGTSTNYNAVAAWSCGRVPTSSDNIEINHAVTVTGNITYQWATQTITVNTGGYLKITGDMLMRGAGEKIVINGGTLEVVGKLTVQNGGVTVDVNGGTLKV